MLQVCSSYCNGYNWLRKGKKERGGGESGAWALEFWKMSNLSIVWDEGHFGTLPLFLGYHLKV